MVHRLRRMGSFRGRMEDRGVHCLDEELGLNVGISWSLGIAFFLVVL